MSTVGVPELGDSESWKQLPVEQLVAIIVEQKTIIHILQQELERLKVSVALDSQTSSLPPSTDLLKKPTKPKENSVPTSKDLPKRKPGGQPGHEGKTRQGFGRIDQYQVLRPESCSGSIHLWQIYKLC